MPDVVNKMQTINYKHGELQNHNLKKKEERRKKKKNGRRWGEVVGYVG